MAEEKVTEKARGAKGRRGEGSKTPVTTMLDVIYMVSRAAGTFEAILKTKEPGLSLSQWAILETLNAEGGTARPTQLARKLGCSRQMIRQAAQKLIKLELIGAETSDEDRKAVSLHLTDAGRAHLQVISTAIDGFVPATRENKVGARANSFGGTARTLRSIVSALSADTKGSGQRKNPAVKAARPADA